MQERLNILFILTDQQHAGMMGCAGNSFVQTPAMDSLAATGVRFDRAYCTNPLCIPSRFSLMTGHMPSEINLYSNLQSRVGAVPESIQQNGLGFLMQKAGYDVGYAGKQHLPCMHAADLGFSCISEDERDELPVTCEAFFNRPREQPFMLVASLINPHDICYMALRDFATDASELDLIKRGTVECETLDEALRRPAEAEDDATFFARHCPPLPPNFEPQEGEPEAYRLMLQQRPFRINARNHWHPERWREHRWAYARLTARVDRQVGAVLAALEASGQRDRTLIVFTSDHGDMDATHRMEHKSTFYDEACRIPLLVCAPGCHQGTVDTEHLVSNGLDLLPTFCDWAGISPPSGLAGRSLRPLVEAGQATSPWRQSLPIESATGHAIVTQHFKYAQHDIGEQAEQLLDLAHDPHETVNAVNQPEHQQQLATLRTTFHETFGRICRDPADVLEDAAQA